MDFPEVTPNSYVRLRAEGVKWKEVSGTIVVMDLQGASYFAVEGSIAAAWPSLAAGAIIGDLAKIISDDYEAPLETITDDLLMLVRQLLKRGVVDHVDTTK